MKNIFELDFSFQINSKTENEPQYLVEAENLDLAKKMATTFIKSIRIGATNFVFLNSRQLSEKQKALVCPGKLLTASDYNKWNNKIK